jgi:tetratricopeptide (TPR) repeat protein
VRAHTQTDTHANAHRRSPSPARTLSLCCCQIKAWKAGHKGECAASAQAVTRTTAKPGPTADQMRVLEILEQLAGAADWRGVAAQERSARAVAAAVRTSMPGIASFVYCILGNAYQNLGNFSKALEHHKEHLTMAKEVGDRAGEGVAYANLGIAYFSQGDYAKAIKYQTQHLAIAKEVGDRAREGVAHANLARRSQGDFSKAIEYHTQHLAITRRWATGRGRWARRTETSAARISRRGTMRRPSITTRRAWRLQRTGTQQPVLPCGGVVSVHRALFLGASPAQRRVESRVLHAQCRQDQAGEGKRDLQYYRGKSDLLKSPRVARHHRQGSSTTVSRQKYKPKP